MIQRILLLLFCFSSLIPLGNAFSDLPETHPYHFALTYLQGEKVIEGYADGTVRPDVSVNRAELIKILVEGQKLLTGKDTSHYQNCFPDVNSEWFASYVCYAAEKYWVTGYPDGYFRPEQPVNKVEALKIIINSFKLGTTSPPLSSPFEDVEINAWYIPYLQTALNTNIVEEKGQKIFAPASNRTRGQVAENIARILQMNYMQDPVYSDLIRSEFQTWMLINQLRLNHNITEKLQLNRSLTVSARTHSQDMAENLGQLSHTGSDSTNVWDRIKNTGFQYTGGSGENIGRGTISSNRSIYDAILHVHDTIFMVEPDGVCNHRTTILSTCMPFKQVGIGVYIKDGYTYFTEDFVTDAP